MRDIDKGRAEPLVQLADLRARLDAQLGVEVGQRLVHQEHRRVAYDGTSERHALALAARERFGLAIEILRDREHVRRLLDTLVDLRLGYLAQLETERHVVVDRHVRVQGVALEHHRDVAILRRDVVDTPVANVDRAVSDLFQSRQQAQRRCLAAA